jgi:hypothetical protein
MKTLYDSLAFIGGGASLIGGTLGLIFGLELHKAAEVAQKSASCTVFHQCPSQPPDVWVFAVIGALPGALIAVYKLMKKTD